MTTTIVYAVAAACAIALVVYFARTIWHAARKGIQSEPIIELRESERDQARAGLDAHRGSDATPDDLLRILRDGRD